RLDFLQFLFREIAFGDGLQPILGNLDWLLAVIGENALEDLVEDLVEAIEQAFVLNEGGAREVVERFRRQLDSVLVECLEQYEVLLEGSGNSGSAELIDKVEEHASD